MKVKIWDALNSEEEDADEVEVDVPDHDMDDGYTDFCLNRAAAEFMEKGWSDSDYPETMEVSIRFPSGRLQTFLATAEPTVDFVASRKS